LTIPKVQTSKGSKYYQKIEETIIIDPQWDQEITGDLLVTIIFQAKYFCEYKRNI